MNLIRMIKHCFAYTLFYNFIFSIPIYYNYLNI